MLTSFTIILSITVLLLVIVLVKTFFSNNNLAMLQALDRLQVELQRVENSVRTEISGNRIEMLNQSSHGRRELQLSLQSFEEKLNHLTDTIDHKLRTFNEGNTQNAITSRKDIREALEIFKTDLGQSIKEFNQHQKDHFLDLLRKQGEQNTDTGNRLDMMRQTLEQKITLLQQGNEKKLDEMRATVEEKLQQTLETRLGESFRLVSERLEAVHKGLGDMQQLATGVGDLKKVLSNVKTRGVMGEYQLEALLEQTLTPDQYAKNVRTKAGSNAIVEFAVKLPGHNSRPLWLPIDSKFPKEDFELLGQAYEQADAALVEESRKAFVRGIKKCAADICNKYIDAPNTTDFAILFLPFESLYAEVLRTPGLFETIRTEFKINITGPTTLSAFLSSLQMGFRTLGIEKRSSEVYEILKGVKTEFSNFSFLLDKAQKNIQTGLNQLEDLGSIRTRAIEKKLKNIDVTSNEQVQQVLPGLLGNEAQSNAE